MNDKSPYNKTSVGRTDNTMLESARTRIPREVKVDARTKGKLRHRLNLHWLSNRSVETTV